MEVSKSFVHMNHLKNQIVTQITLDDDFNVPDVNADIDKYITSDAMIHVDNVKVSEGRANVRGHMEFKILYCSDENRNLVHSMENMITFDEMINGDQLGSNDMVNVKCDIDDLNIGIINTRKISVRAVLTLTLSAEEMCDVEMVEALKEDDAAQYRIRKEPLLQIVVNKKDTYRIREDIELSGNKPNISEILWNTVTLNNINTKLHDGNVGISGELGFFVMYEGEEDLPVQWMETNIPFDGKMEVAECEEGMIGDIEVCIANISLNMKPDYDGEQRVLELEVVLELTMRIYREDEMNILCDVYSLKNELTPKYEKVSYSTLCMKNICRCKVQDRLKLDKDNGHMMQLLCAQGNVLVEDTIMQDNGILVEGIVKMKIMYVSSDDQMPLNIADEVVPFSHLIEAQGISGESMAFIRPSLEQINTNMTGNNEVEVKCTVVLDALVIGNGNSQFITEVEAMPLDLKKLQNIPSMAGYMVKDKDTLWDIAKRYCTTVESIMKMNERKNEAVRKGEMLFIIKATP